MERPDIHTRVMFKNETNIYYYMKQINFNNLALIYESTYIMKLLNIKVIIAK